MRRTWSYGTLVVLASLLCACQRETLVEHGNRNQIFHRGNGTEPQDIDPHIVTGVPEHHIITALLEGLVVPDPKDLHATPGVAERWELSPDQTVYTFHLRKNAKWSSGDPVTAHDFVRSWKRMLTPTLASEYAYMLFVMKNAEAFNKGELTNFDEVGAKAVDDFTLQITLNAPTGYFLNLIQHYSWYPVHIPTLEKHGKVYERGNRWTRPQNFVGNGPFVIKEWKVNHIFIAKKSPTYWDADTVRLNEIYFHPIESSDTDDRAFRGGQLHKSYEVPSTKIEGYRKNKPELLHIDPYLGVYFYTVNVKRKPFTDKRVRRALAMSIDRKAIVENVTKGGQLPAEHFTPPSTAGYTATARVRSNVQEARRLLAEAGFPDGKGFPPMEILFNTLESHKTIAEAIQQMWAKNLGIEVKLLNQEWKVYLSTMKELRYDVARFGWIGDYADPNSFLDMWVTGGGNNRSGWSNPEYDKLIQEAGRTIDPKKRLEVFDRAETILMDELPCLPIYFYTRVYLMQPNVRGWYPTIIDEHPYKFIYLENPLTKVESTLKAARQ